MLQKLLVLYRTFLNYYRKIPQRTEAQICFWALLKNFDFWNDVVIALDPSILLSINVFIQIIQIYNHYTKSSKIFSLFPHPPSKRPKSNCCNF